MMNKEAIKQLQESTSVPALIQQLAEANTQIPLLVSPSDFSLNSLEKYMPNASRYRMGFETTSVGDYIAYNKKFDELGATCFVDAESMRSKTIFDLGTVEAPKHKEHSAKLKLNKTAAFLAFYNISGDHLDQRRASDFITDWSDFISSCQTAEGTSLTPTVVSNAMRDITIDSARQSKSQVGDFGASMSSMERIEATSDFKIPSEIRFRCCPYLGLKEREFRMRVSILVGSDRPQIVFRILRMEAVMEEIAEEFKAILVDAFDELELEAYIGEA